jgi:hypothetical protein
MHLPAIVARMNAESNGEILFLLDDGWRHEKQVIMRYLNEQLPFSIATHNAMTHQFFQANYTVHLLPVIPVNRHPLYTPAIYFARELDTVLIRRQRADWLASRSGSVRLLHRIRRWLGQIGLRPYRYEDALAWLYRGSNHYAEVLAPYKALIYNPVSVRDKRILFEARARGMKLISWVYSWDNPFKDNEFLSCADAYLVWNKENLNDVANLHGVPREKIHVVGPAQMDYLKGRPDAPPVPPARRYVLYPCAIGRDVLITQEIEVILDLRDLLDAIDPTVELLVRPYPFRINNHEDHYTALRQRKGITVARFGELVDKRILINAGVEEERYVQFRDAVCLVNMGSTIGLEAAYTQTPLIQLAYCDAKTPSEELALRHVFKNEHLRYMITPEYPNVVKNRTELEACLRDILSGNTTPYQPYSASLRNFSDPLKAPSYKQVLCDTIRQLLVDWGYRREETCAS